MCGFRFLMLTQHTVSSTLRPVKAFLSQKQPGNLLASRRVNFNRHERNAGHTTDLLLVMLRASSSVQQQQQEKQEAEKQGTETGTLRRITLVLCCSQN